MTAAQRRYLAAIVAAGEKSYNGRARKPVTALRDAGLVTYEFDLVPHYNGRYTELFIVRPTEAGIKEVQS
jgi:hypothetical protein